MSTTGHINAVQINFIAQDQIAADTAAGTYDANIASDARYYLWQGNQQTIPVGMAGDPAGFVTALHTAMPTVNTLRLSFNAASFNADGTMHPEYEAFLTAAAAQGFKIIMTYHDGELQRLGTGNTLTPDQIEAALGDGVHTRTMATWEKMLTWMDGHTDVKDAIYAYENANEPAAYERVATYSADGIKWTVEQRMMEMYVAHVAEIADLVNSHDTAAQMLVAGWGYSGQFSEFTDHMVGDVTARDFLKAALGEKLIWSSHFYPGYHVSDEADSAADFIAAYEDVFAALGDDNILVTETNLHGSQINDHSVDPSVVALHARTQEWFAEKGIGLTWFAGAQAGGSSFVTIDPGQTLRFLHQHSYAHGLNAFSLDDSPAANAGDETVAITLIAGRLRNEAYEADYKAGQIFDPVANLGLGFGYGGNDTLRGSDLANNFLYGGHGTDRMSGADHEDFLFGQYGNDSLNGDAEDDLLFGGSGNDTLRGDTGNDQLEGGSGADHFDARYGSDIIVDYSAAQKDVIFLGYPYDTWSDVAARISYAAVNGAAVNDVVIRHANGTTTTILDARSTFTTASLRYAGTKSAVDGTTASESLSAGFKDIDGQVFGTTLFQIAAGAGNDTVTGGAAQETLRGDAGHDLIKAAAGADHIYGGTGRDSVTGGDGNDFISGSDDADRLSGSDGADVIYGGSHVDHVFGGADADKISGGTGADAVDGGSGADYITLGSGYDWAVGDTGRDTIKGGTGNDKLYGEAGGDVLRGESGVDALYGGSGDDWLSGGTYADAISGAVGQDTAFGGSNDDKIFLGTDDDKAYGGTGRDRIYGQDGRDFIYGGDQADYVNAGTGADTVYGGASDDHLRMQQGSDIGYGGTGDDTMSGLSGHDQLYGGSGRDVIYSGKDRSVLSGGSENDRLQADLDRDGHRLTGGKGQDTFIFVDAKDATDTYSTITDFQLGHDRLIISGKTIALRNLPDGMTLVERAEGSVLTFGSGDRLFLEDLFV